MPVEEHLFEVLTSAGWKSSAGVYCWLGAATVVVSDSFFGGETFKGDFWFRLDIA